MLGTRHEEYAHLMNTLPFQLKIGIHVTATTFNHEANWHDNPEIQLCTNGSGTVLLDEKKIPFQKNDIVVVNSNVIHHTNTSDSISYTCLIIDTQFCKQMDIDPLSLQFIPKIQSKSLVSLLQTLEQLYQDKTDVCRIAKMNDIIIRILIELCEQHSLTQNTQEIKKHSFEVIKNTIKFIRLNYEKKLSLDEIARQVFIDKYTLSKEFKKLTNQTIVQYINSYRCKKAAEYILEGYSVSNAARLCGFSHMSFFTKTFQTYMGCLPSEYKHS